MGLLYQLRWLAPVHVCVCVVVVVVGGARSTSSHSHRGYTAPGMWRPWKAGSKSYVRSADSFNQRKTNATR